MKTLAMSGQYGLFGTDWVRFHTVANDSAVVLVHARTGAVLPSLPTAYVTSGHMANLTGRIDVAVLMSAVPNTAIAKTAHAWKAVIGLDTLAAKFGLSAENLASLKASYADVDAIAA